MILSLPSHMALAQNDESKVFQSSNQPTLMLEVYTSQGCSSCPPAERWLSGFVEHSALWDGFVPLNFHVDYWDFLGWKDPFSRSTFSYRQKDYVRKNHVDVAATPGFVVNGKGWRGWFYGNALPAEGLNPQYSLKATLKNGKLTVNYQSPESRSLVVHVATLGFDLQTSIARGENRGRILKHDFVVIGYTNAKLDYQTALYQQKLDMPKPFYRQPVSKQALVVWVSEQRDPRPLQVLAGWL